MKRQPEQPQRLRPADPRLPAIRAAAPCNLAEQHRSEAPIPAQNVEL